MYLLFWIKDKIVGVMFVIILSLCLLSCNNVLDKTINKVVIYNDYSKHNIHYFIESTNIKIDSAGNKQCDNYNEINKTDTSITIQAMSLQDLFTSFCKYPRLNINITESKNPKCFFNIKIQGKYLNDSLIVEDLKQIFDLQLESTTEYKYIKKLNISDTIKLLANKINDFNGYRSCRIVDNILCFKNYSLLDIAEYLQDHCREKIICNEQDTNLYSFCISSNLNKIPLDLVKYGISLDTIYALDTMYLFY